MKGSGCGLIVGIISLEGLIKSLKIQGKKKACLWIDFYTREPSKYKGEYYPLFRDLL
jgi:hypothetical protein